MPNNLPNSESDYRQRQFATTHWSVVLAAGAEDQIGKQALSDLCQAYWYPVYAYVRRQVNDVHQAQDQTQAFFATLLEKRTIEGADPQRGRFRAYLLTACKRFLVNQWHRDRAQKRGGDRVALSLDFDSAESNYTAIAVDAAAADVASPERIFEQQWAMTLLGRVLDKLGEEMVAKGKTRHFEQLAPFLAGKTSSADYAVAAGALGISEGAVKVAAHRLRTRYRELLRGEIAQTVSTADEIEDEIQSLFAVLSSGNSVKML